MTITIEKFGFELNIFSKDEYGSYISEKYYYFSKKEAIKKLK